VNVGNDADTIGAIYGQLVGAFYDAEQIPAEWRKLAMHDFIVDHAGYPFANAYRGCRLDGGQFRLPRIQAESPLAWRLLDQVRLLERLAQRECREPLRSVIPGP